MESCLMSGSPLLHSTPVTPRWPDVPSANSCYSSPTVHASRYGSTGDMYSPLAPRRNSEYEHAQHFPGFAYINGEATTGWAKWISPGSTSTDARMQKAIRTHQWRLVFNMITENVSVLEWDRVSEVCLLMWSVFTVKAANETLWSAIIVRVQNGSIPIVPSTLYFSFISLKSIINYSLSYCAHTWITDPVSEWQVRISHGCLTSEGVLLFSPC